MGFVGTFQLSKILGTSKVQFCKNLVAAASSITAAHCAFSSNLFHCHIVQKYIHQMSPPENKKCRTGKVFGMKPPSNLATFEQERPQMPGCEAVSTLHQPKMTCCNFSNFCRKKFPGLTKKFLTFLYNFGGCNLQKSCGKTSRLIQ